LTHTTTGRASDNWTPLLGIAGTAGWLSYAKELPALFSYRERDPAELLIQDVYSLFEEHGVDRLPSEEIVKSLAEMEHRPWPEWKGRGTITKAQLAAALAPFDIMPTTIRFGPTLAKGYYKAAFDDLVSRFGGEEP